MVAMGVGGILLLVGFSLFMVYRGVPGMAGGSQRATHATAVSRLRTLLWAQDHFRQLKAADRDGDGTAEYGLLAQLSGQPGGLTTPPPAVLGDGSFSRFSPGALGGVAVFAGYCYTVYLPARAGGAVAELQGGGELPGTVDPDGAETHWVAYAWPLEWGKTGNRVFFINQDEEIWESRGGSTGSPHNGPQQPPAFDAALARADFSVPPQDGHVGGDGAVWTRWKGKQARSK